MKFTDIFIKRPVLSIVVSLLILLIGARAMFSLPIRQYPKLENTVISVTTVYPGATAELMQGFITTPLEQAVASAEGIEYMTSSSTPSSSVINAYIQLNFDPDKAMTEVMAKVQQVKYLIPKEANDPVITKTTGQGFAVMYLGFSSNELARPAISDYLARVVQPMLSTVDGVSSADILGGQTFAMRVWLDPARMAARGISADDVSNAILANNFQSAPGQAKGYFNLINITAETGLTNLDEFRDMVVKAQGGALVRLKDIAVLDLGAQNTNSSVAMSGQHAVFIGVNATPLGNPLTIVQGVRALLPTIERDLPPSVKMAVAYDSTKFITASINEVYWTLGQAAVIVVLVIFLFLGSLRSVVIPVVTIPLSLIGVAMFMLAMGFSLNLLTLLAFVLAIGLVVDDAIVVVENIYRHIEGGKMPVQAALLGAREIVGPVIAMTITLAAVYAPIGFQSGLTGVLFREFAFTLAGAVIISGIVALTLSPMMCSMLLTRTMHEGRFPKLVDRVFARVTAAYSRRLHASLDYRPVTALFAAGVLASVFFLYSHSFAELAPAEDQGVLFSQTKGPQYANIDYMDAFSDQLDTAFRSFPETDATFVLAGVPNINQGFAGAILKPWADRTRTAQQLNQPMNTAVSTIEGLKIAVFSLPPLPTSAGGLPVQMVISSPGGYQTIYQVMDQLKQAANKSGIFIFTDSDLDYNAPGAHLIVDRAKANDLGVKMQTIGDTLAVLVGENFVNRFDLQGRSYEVIPQVPRALRLSADLLTQYYVPTSSGQQVPISTVVSVKNVTEANALTQYNQINSATFSAVLRPGVSMGSAVDFLNDQASKLLPQGFNHDFLSEARQYVQEGGQLLITMVFALIVIFLVLAAQFESLRDPLVIMTSVPMSICGALLPLFAGVATVNIYSQVGLVTLVGLISKHGILMVEFANQAQIAERLDKRAAIEHAARVRLRPILMTTAAMVVGLVPLIFAHGAGAASRFSIGLVIVTGMSIGTLFTLFVLPAVYTYLAKDHAAAASAPRVREIAEVS
ncbi:MAG TPA: efflux RND transporter permease subunit [Stellaceae bacterium]|nr:efflux RND transporter permease subunit [Stellaceae bacterium]